MTDPALPTTSRGPAAPSTTVGPSCWSAADPASAAPPANRSYSPSMLFRCIAVPGRSRRTRSGRRRERCGVPVAVDDRHVRRARRRAGSRAPRLASRIRVRPASARRRRRRAGAVRAHRGAAHARSRPRGRASARASPRRGSRAPRAPGAPLPVAVEQREPVGDQDAARRRRRVRDHVEAAEAHSGSAAARSTR